MPKWLLSSVLELLSLSAPIDLLALVVASWIFYFGQTYDERGKPIEIIDARSSELARVAMTSRGDARPFLAIQSIFGKELPSNPEFVQSVDGALRRLSEHGVHSAIEHYLSRAL